MLKTIQFWSFGLLFVLSLLAHSPQANADQIDNLIAQLNSSDREVRRDAMRELESSRYRSNDRILEPLINAMRTSTDSSVRENAAETLSRHNNSQGLQSVIETLSNPSYGLGHEAAADALRYVRSSTVKPVLLANINHSSDRVRRNIADGLGYHVADSAVVEALVNSIKNDSNSQVRENAADSIARLPAAQAVAILAPLLQNSNGSVAVARSLGYIRSDAVIVPLLSVLNSSNREMRRAAVRGLEKYSARTEVFEALYQRFNQESDSYVKSYLFDAMANSSDPRMLELARANVNSTDSSIRRDSIEILKKRGSKEDLIALIALLGNSSESTRLDALEAIRAIISRMSSKDPMRTRLAACMPSTTNHEFKEGTKQAALLMDILLAGFGMYSAAAHGGYKKVERLSSEQVQGLQDLVRELLREDDAVGSAPIIE